MDGLFPSLRIYVRHGLTCKRQIPQAGRTDIPGHRKITFCCHRRSGLQRGEDQLYVCLWYTRAWLRTSFVVWDNVYGFNYSCIKDIALREPLVDTVELKAVVTDPYVIKVCCYQFIGDTCLTTFRKSTSWQQQRRTWLSRHPLPLLLHAMTVSMIVLGVIAPFIRVTLDIHAFLAWFDIVFDCTHKKVKFSTGPHAQYTHWKYVCNPTFCSSGIHLLKTGKQCSIPPRQSLSTKGSKLLAVSIAHRTLGITAILTFPFRM